MKNLVLLLLLSLIVACSDDTPAPTTSPQGDAKPPAAPAVDVIDPMADGWPSWLGPTGDLKSKERRIFTTLAKLKLPAGPPIAWEATLTGGYSGMIVSKGRLITMTKLPNQEAVVAYNAVTGKLLWTAAYDCDYSKHPLDPTYASGPRAAPLVDGKKVYTIGTTAIVTAIDSETGKIAWKRDLLAETNAKAPIWGFGASVAVSGEKLFVQPGVGGKGMAALEKATGKILWSVEEDAPGYATPILIKHRGIDQVVFFNATGLVSLAPADGRVLWRFEWKTDHDLNIATPIYFEGHLFISSGYGKGSALIRLTDDGKVEEAWKNKVMKNHYSTSVRDGKFVYGFSDDRLTCMEWESGKRLWTVRDVGKGSLVLVDNHLVMINENGNVVLAKVSTEDYQEQGRWQALNDSVVRTPPTFVDGRLYVRHEKRIVAYDLLYDIVP